MKKIRINKTKTSLSGIKPFEAESLTVKIRKMQESDQAIKEEVPIIYTEKKDGVLPGYDIRTDRFDVALELMDKLNAAELSGITKTESATVLESAESKVMESTGNETTTGQ